jgi:prolyl 4-hydroxylase
LARIPVNHGEGVQVLRYEQSQKYNAHHDFFDPKRYATERRGGGRESERENAT